MTNHTAREQGEAERCRKCGYTYEDCRIHMDHHLCGEPEPKAREQGEQK